MAALADKVGAALAALMQGDRAVDPSCTAAPQR
jgi:hypothetical protein